MPSQRDEDEIDYEPAEPIKQIDFKFEYRKHTVPTSADSPLSGSTKRPKLEMIERENDEKRLKSRQRQIDIGKNTMGYERYVAIVPKVERKREHPKTPDKYQICSKRSWDGQVCKWRKQLHQFDPL